MAVPPRGGARAAAAAGGNDPRAPWYCNIPCGFFRTDDEADHKKKHNCDDKKTKEAAKDREQKNLKKEKKTGKGKGKGKGSNPSNSGKRNNICNYAGVEMIQHAIGIIT